MIDAFFLAKAYEKRILRGKSPMHATAFGRKKKMPQFNKSTDSMQNSNFFTTENF